MAGSREHDNEPSGSIKGGEFLDCLRKDHVLKNDSIVSYLFNYTTNHFLR